MMKYIYMKRVPSNDVIVALKRRIRHVWIACVVGCSCFAISSIGASDAQAQTAQNTQNGYLEQGNALYNQRKYDEAIASYIKSIQMTPRSVTKAYLNCARAYSMKKNYAASDAFYGYYEEVEPTAAQDRKFKAEYKAMQKKARNQAFVRDASQTSVLQKVNELLLAQGPFLTRQGNGVLAYYDVLLRTGYAAPNLYAIQEKIVRGLENELVADITPPVGQPLPNLDRPGWEFTRNKVAKARQFADVAPNEDLLGAIESTARAWESYYRGDYDEALERFETTCHAKTPIPAAFWGRIIVGFQKDKNDALLSQIDEAERVYGNAKIGGVAHYFALLRAQVYRNLDDMEQSLHWLNRMQELLP